MYCTYIISAVDAPRRSSTWVSEQLDRSNLTHKKKNTCWVVNKTNVTLCESFNSTEPYVLYLIIKMILTAPCHPNIHSLDFCFYTNWWQTSKNGFYWMNRGGRNTQTQYLNKSASTSLKNESTTNRSFTSNFLLKLKYYIHALKFSTKVKVFHWESSVY